MEERRRSQESRRDNRRLWLAVGIAFILAPAAGIGLILAPDDATEMATKYRQATPDDVVTRLQHRIDDGEVTLAYDRDRGYLPAVLKALQLPISSQVLVFSKTSIQKELISPQRPRAIYFNDDAYVAYVPTGRALEVSTQDPKLGAVYFVVLQRPTAKPNFFRSVDACMECHGGAMSEHFPGHIMRSVYMDAEGSPDLTAPSYLTTDATPLSRRWGGWYVTGTHGSQRHMGNCTAREQGDAVTLNRDKGANITDLRRFFDTSLYLSPHSDIVALMVLEHQTHLQNLITKANYETNQAINEEKALNQEFGRPENYPAESTPSRIKEACEPLVRAMLFSGEARLTAPIVGTAGFAEQFSARGPYDRKRRSLRQLDLKRRLFCYPCSYTIYSKAFDALPGPAKNYIFRRLWKVLTGQDRSPEFAHLSTTDRKSIREILLETKPAFASCKTR